MTDINRLITDNVELWSSAIEQKTSSGRGGSSKRNLIGIKKLRDLILELAVNGQLVTNSSKKEDTDNSIESLKSIKADLVKNKKIKKPKKLPEIAKDELNPNLPKSWGQMRLGDAINVLNGRAYKRHEMLQEGTPLLRVGNLFTSNEWYYSDLELEADKYIDNGDLIYAWSASFGPFIWEGGKVIYHYHIWKMDIFDHKALDKRFMLHYLAAISEAIKASGNGIAMIHMTKERMEKLVIPVPSLEEQLKIVEKIDELMALCDQLEQQTESSIDAHQLLVEELLSTLTNSENPQEFEQNWARIAEHFDLLFTTEHSIEQLKQNILQLAVMGKLVPQDSSDEPASELLKRIAQEKEQLIKDKVIKKEKALPTLTEEEKPFELPRGWALARVGNLVSKLGSGSTPRGGKAAYVESGVPFLRSQNVWNDGIKTDDIAYIPEDTHNSMSNTKVYPNDVLLNITGASLGRATIFPSELKEANVSQHVTIIRLVEKEMSDFVLLGIHSPMIQSLVWDRQVGVAIEGLSKKVLELFEFPIPPLEEQRRIINKVNELISVCETLSKTIRESNKIKSDLANSIVETALH